MQQRKDKRYQYFYCHGKQVSIRFKFKIKLANVKKSNYNIISNKNN